VCELASYSASAQPLCNVSARVIVQGWAVVISVYQDPFWSGALVYVVHKAFLTSVHLAGGLFWPL